MSARFLGLGPNRHDCCRKLSNDYEGKGTSEAERMYNASIALGYEWDKDPKQQEIVHEFMERVIRQPAADGGFGTRVSGFARNMPGSRLVPRLFPECESEREAE